MYRSGKDTLLVLGVLSAIGAAFAFTVYLPHAREMNEVRSQIASERLRMESNAAQVQSVPAMLAQVEALRGRYNGFDRQLPRSQELFEFLKQIGEELARANLSSQSIKPEAPVREELFHALPIKMEFQGRYPELSRFLAEIDNMERLTRVQRLQVHTQPRGDDLNITVLMNIYFTEG